MNGMRGMELEHKFKEIAEELSAHCANCDCEDCYFYNNITKLCLFEEVISRSFYEDKEYVAPCEWDLSFLL